MTSIRVRATEISHVLKNDYQSKIILLLKNGQNQTVNSQRRTETSVMTINAIIKYKLLSARGCLTDNNKT